MKYEKTQKGNPHALTVRQHTVPVRSIERFSSTDGRVHVRYLRNGKELRLRPEDQFFCATMFAGNVCELLGVDKNESASYAQTYINVTSLAMDSYEELNLAETLRAVGKEL